MRKSVHESQIGLSPAAGPFSHIAYFVPEGTPSQAQAPCSSGRSAFVLRRTSGSTGTEISGRDLIGERPLHRLIDFAASELESYQKGCRKQQGWKPAKSRSFLQCFDRSERISLLITNADKALCCRTLTKLDS